MTFMNRHVALLLLSLCALLLVDAKVTSKGYVFKEAKSKGNDGILKTIATESIIQCGSACSATADCVAFSFSKDEMLPEEATLLNKIVTEFLPEKSEAAAFVKIILAGRDLTRNIKAKNKEI